MTNWSQQNLPHLAGEFSGALCDPRHLCKSAWLGHIPFSFWIVEKLRPATIVELGTHSGASYFAFCQAVEQLKLLTTCYAVDTWKGDEHAGFYDETVFQSVRAINAESYSGFSQLLRMTFDEAFDRLENDRIDLLHIDGLHTYEAVRHDFENWLPRLSDRAVVLLHDTRITRSGFGVHRLFTELAERYPCFEFLHSAGLGVIFVGKDHDPEILAALAHAGGETPMAATTQLFFQRLGERIEMAYQLKAEEAEAGARLEALRKGSEEKAAAIQRRDAEIALLKERIAASARSADEKAASLQRRDAEIAQLRKRAESALSEKAAAAKQLVALEKDMTDRIRLLKGEISHLSDEDARQRKEVDRHVASLAQLGDLLIEASIDKENLENKRRTEMALRMFLYMHSKKRLAPLRYKISTRKAIKALRNCEEFDSDWYLAQYPDVRQSGIDPVEHYYFSGVFEGRNPSAEFNTVQYLLAHADVAKAGINPLLHYVRTGRKENRVIQPADNA